MAGTLTISTLSDGTNSTSSTNCIQGSAKAWARFNGTAATIGASYNVSSITRNSTGLYTVNFTNAFSDANYSGVITGTYGSANNWNNTTPTTTAAQMTTFNTTTGSNQDTAFISVAFFR